MDPIVCLCVFEKILLLTISVSLQLKKHKIKFTYRSLTRIGQNWSHFVKTLHTVSQTEVCVPNCQSFYFSLLCESIHFWWLLHKKRHSMKTFSKIHLFSPTPHANMLFSELLEKLFLFFFFLCKCVMSNNVVWFWWFEWVLEMNCLVKMHVGNADRVKSFGKSGFCIDQCLSAFQKNNCNLLIALTLWLYQK